MSAISVAIDGPAGAGKSTVSKKLALRTGFALLDTGAMYRAATYVAMREGALHDEVRIAELLRNLEIHIHDHITHASINDEDVTDKLRSKEVTANVSMVAALPAVRHWAVSVQRSVVKEELLQGRGIILEGRDIGSVVLPDANIKFFLTASDAVRAQRRAQEIGAPEEIILQEIQKRDSLDSSREISPLFQAEDALLIDASEMSADEVVALMISKIDLL